MTETEQIVFVNEDGTPTGKVGPKLASHGPHTRLHLAFSCYIFRPSDGKFLVTQRALTKKVWPGVWTNSVCGHPAPDENAVDAIRRRAEYELGLSRIGGIRVVLPSYRYKTPPYNGIIENEFCPVYIAFSSEEPRPNPKEVEAYRWMNWIDYVAFLAEEPDKISYWSKDQYKQLAHLKEFPPQA